MQSTYISCANTAKLIRAALKKSFPSVKFSVRSDTYAGGASIRVRWTDGPTIALVDPVALQFAGGRFDGMIDMKISVGHWLLPDGSAAVASSPGTVGSMGVIPEQREWMPDPGGKLVHFGADYVFCDRDYSEKFIRQACARLARNGFPQFAAVEIDTGFSGSAWIKNDRAKLHPEHDWCHVDIGQRLREECSKLVIA